MSNSGQGYWECRRVGGTHTRDTGGKDGNLSPHKPALSLSLVFALSVADQSKEYNTIKRLIGGLVGLW